MNTFSPNQTILSAKKHRNSAKQINGPQSLCTALATEPIVLNKICEVICVCQNDRKMLWEFFLFFYIMLYEITVEQCSLYITPHPTNHFNNSSHISKLHFGQMISNCNQLILRLWKLRWGESFRTVYITNIFYRRPCTHAHSHTHTYPNAHQPPWHLTSS